MTRARRLLTIGHSYVVALNRRLANEMALAGQGRWKVTTVAPQFVHGDLRPIPFEPIDGEVDDVRTYAYRFSRRPHFSLYSRKLRSLVRTDWDLVHIWHEPYVAAGFQLSRWVRPEVPLVIATLQNINKRYPPPFSWFERYCLQKACGWVACGQTTVDTMYLRGYTDKPHRILPLGVDTNLFRADSARGATIRRRLGWSNDGPPVVGYLGRFAPQKGLAMLMRTLDRLSTPWRALFVGGGPLEAELRSWANGYSNGRAQIVTNVPHDEVPAHINAMDILAAPSQTTPIWREQQGRMLIEAMSSGVPVVGSDSAEIPYVIAEAGRIVAETDETAWLNCLTQLLENPTERRELAALGRERALEEYAWPVIARRHLEFFDELLDAPKRRQIPELPAS